MGYYYFALSFYVQSYCRLELTVILMHEELFVSVSELTDDYTDTSENRHDWIDFEMVFLTLMLSLLSADNLGKQFGSRSGMMNHRARSGSKLFDILMVVLLKRIFSKS